MGSIPLPALDLKPVQQPDVMAQMGNLYRLKAAQQQLANAPLETQALQQQVQSGQLGIQQQQQALKDQQAFRSAMTDPSMKGKTIGDVADALAQKGAISQQSWVAAKKADVEQKTALAGLDEKTLANFKAAHQQTQELYNNVMNMPDDQLQANWPQIAQQYDAIPGNQKMPLDPNHPMTKQQLAQFGPVLSMGNSYFDQELERRKKIADTTLAEQNSQYGPTGPAADAKYRFILAQKAAGRPVSDADLTWARGYEASKAENTTTSDTLGVTSNNFRRPAGLSAVGWGWNGRPHTANPPGSGGGPTAGTANGSTTNAASIKSDTVDLIGQYRMDPALLGRMLYKHPEMLGLIHQKYPDWDQTTYQAKNSLIKGYTSGTQSKEINAINTAMGHVKVLDDAVAALNNGDVNVLNSIANKVGAATGNDAQTTFRLIVHRVGPEISSAYVPGGGGEAERFANEKDFSENLAPQQLHNNAAVTVKLLRSKVGALENQYKNTVGRDDFAQRFITPEAQAAFQRFGGQNAGGPQPKEGTTKTNSHGDTVVFKDGKWQLQ